MCVCIDLGVFLVVWMVSVRCLWDVRSLWVDLAWTDK